MKLFKRFALLSLLVASFFITHQVFAEAPTATNLSAAETYTEDTPLNLIDIVISDIDSPNVTVTLTLLSPIYGSFNVGTSGAVTSTYNAGTGVWTASGAIANVNTLLAGLIFTPTANSNSNFSIATNVSDGVASITGSKTMTGIAINDAPVLDTTKTPNLTSISQDAGAPSGSVGTLVSSLVDFASPAGQIDNVTDADSAPQLGIAIIATNSSSLTCYYSLNNGSTWTPMGPVSNTSARLLAANGTNRVYCNAGSGVSGSFSDAITFRAWDQTSGVDGGFASTASSGGATAFSTASDTATLTVNSNNHAPVLDATKTPTLNSIAENSGTPSGSVGTSIDALVDLTSPAGSLDNVTDSDASPLSGIAVISKDSGLTCYYSINDGNTWLALGDPSTSSARLLAANSSTRIYCRAAINIDGIVASAITFKAWDQTSGTNGGAANVTTSGGTTAFSSASDTASLTVTDSGTTQHIPIAIDDEYLMTEDATATALFVLNNDTDDDNDSLSLISVTTPSHGTAAIYDTAVVYTPTANYCGVDSFDYVMTDGISEDTGTVNITISCVNDAPVLDTTKSPVLVSVDQNAGNPIGAVGTLIGALVDMTPPSGGLDNVTDGDSDASAGIAIVAINSRLTCYYSVDGGVSWSAIGAVSSGAARALAADSDNRIYCKPEVDFSGAIASAITFRAWDLTSGTDGGVVDTSAIGGITPFSTNTDTASIMVNSVDTLAPETFINIATTPGIDSSSATFEFSSNESPVTYECGVSTGGSPVFTSCTSPFTSTLFIPGNTYSFYVRSKDAADNVDPSPAFITWTVSNIILEHVTPVNGETNVATTTHVGFDFAGTVPESLRDLLSLEYLPLCTNCSVVEPEWSDVNKHVEYTNTNGPLDANTTYTISLRLNNGLTSGIIYEGTFTTKPKTGTSVGGRIPNFVSLNTQNVPLSGQDNKKLTYHFPRTLKFGMTGDDVVILQKFLGITPPASKHFGPLTKATLIKYQKDHGLDADGIAGPKTFRVIESELNK